MLPHKPRSRYLPTLTHVVTAVEKPVADMSASPANMVSHHNYNELLVQQIIQSLVPLISARIKESLQEILDDKLHHLEANMQLEMESMVRGAVNRCNVSSNA